MTATTRFSSRTTHLYDGWLTFVPRTTRFLAMVHGRDYLPCLVCPACSRLPWLDRPIPAPTTVADTPPQNHRCTPVASMTPSLPSLSRFLTQLRGRWVLLVGLDSTHQHRMRLGFGYTWLYPSRLYGLPGSGHYRRLTSLDSYPGRCRALFLRFKPCNHPAARYPGLTR